MDIPQGGLVVQVHSQRRLLSSTIDRLASVSVADKQFGIAGSQVDWRGSTQQRAQVTSVRRMEAQAVSPLGDVRLSLNGSHTGLEASSLLTGDQASNISVAVQDQVSAGLLAGPGSTATVSVKLSATGLLSSNLNDSGGNTQLQISSHQSLDLVAGTMSGFSDPGKVSVEIQLRSTALERSSITLGDGDHNVAIEAGFGLQGSLAPTSDGPSIALEGLWPAASEQQVQISAAAVGLMQSQLALGGGNDQVLIAARFDPDVQETLIEAGSPGPGQTAQVALWDSRVALGEGSNQLSLEGAVLNSTISGGSGSDILTTMAPTHQHTAPPASPAPAPAAPASPGPSRYRPPGSTLPAVMLRDPYVARILEIIRASHARWFQRGKPNTPPPAPESPWPTGLSALPPTTSGLALWQGQLNLDGGDNLLVVEGAVINTDIHTGAGDDAVVLKAQGDLASFNAKAWVSWGPASSGTAAATTGSRVPGRRLPPSAPAPAQNLQPAQLQGLALSNGRIALGEGNNSLEVHGVLLNSTLSSGSGSDWLSLSATGSNGSVLDAGGGSDWLQLQWAPWQGSGAGLTVRSGEGADLVVISGLEATPPSSWDRITGLPVFADLSLSPQTNGDVVVGDQLGWQTASGEILWLQPTGVDGLGTATNLPVITPQGWGLALAQGTAGSLAGETSPQLAILTGAASSTLVLLTPGSGEGWVPVAVLPQAVVPQAI